MNGTNLLGILYQFVGHQEVWVDRRWRWKIRPRRIMTRKHVFSFPSSTVRVSSSFANDVDHVSKPNRRREFYNAIPNHNFLRRKHIIERELRLSNREPKGSIVIDEGNIERGPKTWCDLQRCHIPTINFCNKKCRPCWRHLSLQLPEQATFARNEQ